MKALFRRGFASKVYKSGKEALFDIKDGATLMIPGFGIVGAPENSLRWIHEKKIKDLTLFTNSVGLTDFCHGPLITSGQTKRIYVSFLGFYHILEKLYLEGKAEVYPIPQGSLVEKMRCAKAGLGGFYTQTSAGTLLEEGKFPVKTDSKGVPEKYSVKKEGMKLDGKDYVFEEPINADYTLIKGYAGDKYGNIRFRKLTRNFNPDIAGAGKVTVAEVEHFVDRLDPDQIHLPGIFVDRIYQGEWYVKKIERLALKEIDEEIPPQDSNQPDLKIARRLAREYQSGMYINLGVGLPGETTRFIPKDLDVNFQVQNGIVGSGPSPKINEIDCDLVNAGKASMTANPGHSIMSSAEAFGIMRGNHLHMTVLGGMEVSEEGDLANYFIPGKMYRGVGGAMDLVSGCDYVLVGMEHSYNGRHRVLKKCNLPLTAKKCVKKLVTQHAVFEFHDSDPRMVLVELTPEMTLEELKKITPARYSVSPNLRPYQL